MEHCLWGFAQGTETPPGQTEASVVRNAYKVKADKAYSLIASSVTKSLPSTYHINHGSCRSLEHFVKEVRIYFHHANC